MSLLFGKKEMTEEEWENERARELERIEREEEEAVGQLYAEILAQMNKYSDQLRNLYSSIVPRLIQRSADYGSFFDEVNAGQTASAFAPFKIHYKAEMPQILSELTDEPKNFVSVKKIRNLMR